MGEGEYVDSLVNEYATLLRVFFVGECPRAHRRNTTKRVLWKGFQHPQTGLHGGRVSS